MSDARAPRKTGFVLLEIASPSSPVRFIPHRPVERPVRLTLRTKARGRRASVATAFAKRACLAGQPGEPPVICDKTGQSEGSRAPYRSSQRSAPSPLGRLQGCRHGLGTSVRGESLTPALFFQKTPPKRPHPRARARARARPPAPGAPPRPGRGTACDRRKWASVRAAASSASIPRCPRGWRRDGSCRCAWRAPAGRPPNARRRIAPKTRCR